jgi:hypothetical protein
MLRRARLTQTARLHDLSDRPRTLKEQRDDLATVGVGEGGPEGGVGHGLNMPRWLYSRQGMHAEKQTGPSAVVTPASPTQRNVAVSLRVV